MGKGLKQPSRAGREGEGSAARGHRVPLPLQGLDDCREVGPQTWSDSPAAFQEGSQPPNVLRHLGSQAVHRHLVHNLQMQSCWWQSTVRQDHIAISGVRRKRNSELVTAA
jgi:hypothetical protein